MADLIPHLSIVASQRQVLSRLGVTCWVSKEALTAKEQNYQDTRLDLSSQSLGQNSTSVEPSFVPDENKAHKDKESLEPTSSVNHHSPNDASVQTVDEAPPQYDNTTLKPSHNKHQVPIVHNLPAMFDGVQVSVEQFWFSGVGYGDWVILVDKFKLERESEAIWQALKQRLEQDQATLSLEIRYPLMDNDYPAYRFEQGSHSLLGFLLRLCAHRTPKIALLSELSSGIQLGALSKYIIPTPSLNQMATFSQNKKHFWQQIHS